MYSRRKTLFPIQGFLLLSSWNVCPSLAKDCGNLPRPLNGSVIGDKTTYPSEVEFECDAGFNLQGSTIRRCEADGQWSGVEVKCRGTFNLYEIRNSPPILFARYHSAFRGWTPWLTAVLVVYCLKKWILCFSTPFPVLFVNNTTVWRPQSTFKSLYMTIVHGLGFTCLSQPFSFFVFQGVNKITKKRSLLVKESCYDKAL